MDPNAYMQQFAAAQQHQRQQYMQQMMQQPSSSYGPMPIPLHHHPIHAHPSAPSPYGHHGQPPINSGVSSSSPPSLPPQIDEQTAPIASMLRPLWKKVQEADARKSKRQKRQELIAELLEKYPTLETSDDEYEDGGSEEEDEIEQPRASLIEQIDFLAAIVHYQHSEIRRLSEKCTQLEQKLSVPPVGFIFGDYRDGISPQPAQQQLPPHQYRLVSAHPTPAPNASSSASIPKLQQQQSQTPQQQQQADGPNHYEQHQQPQSDQSAPSSPAHSFSLQQQQQQQLPSPSSSSAQTTSSSSAAAVPKRKRATAAKSKKEEGAVGPDGNPIQPAPKRKPTQFQLFMQAEMPKLRAENPTANQKEIFKIATANWCQISGSTPGAAKARKDKTRENKLIAQQQAQAAAAHQQQQQQQQANYYHQMMQQQQQQQQQQMQAAAQKQQQQQYQLDESGGEDDLSIDEEDGDDVHGFFYSHE